MKSRKTVSILSLGVLLIGSLVLIFSRSLAVEAAYPAEHAVRLLRTHVISRLTGLCRGAAAEAENVRLRRDLASLEVLRTDLCQLEDENARLREALGYVQRERGSWIAAGVLSRGGGAAGVRDTIRIDKGSFAGIVEGAVVLVPEGLVGRISSVSPHTAEVVLVTDPSVRVACEIASRASGILSGGGEHLLLIRHLLGIDSVRLPARVQTSGRGGIFPRGLPVGTLQSLGRDAQGATGNLVPAVDFSALEDVFVRRGN